MRIGDLEYTRHVEIDTTVALISVNSLVSYAVGIKVRPLLTRVQVTMHTAGAVSGSAGVFLENGESVPVGLDFNALLNDARVSPLAFLQKSLVTSGFPNVLYPVETMWWKLLLPTIALHFVAPNAGDDASVILHYRFAELTDDEIIEIAAQRAQG